MGGFLSAWLSGAGCIQLNWLLLYYVRVLLVVYFEDEILPIVLLLLYSFCLILHKFMLTGVLPLALSPAVVGAALCTKALLALRMRARNLNNYCRRISILHSLV